MEAVPALSRPGIPVRVIPAVITKAVVDAKLARTGQNVWPVRTQFLSLFPAPFRPRMFLTSLQSLRGSGLLPWFPW